MPRWSGRRRSDSLGGADIASQQELAALQARIQALEDERDILRTFYAYSHTIDSGKTREWAECFTADGVFNVFMVDGTPVHRENNRTELKAYLGSKQTPPEVYDKHILAAPVLRIAGDKATAESFFVAIGDGGQGPLVFTFGRYKDTLVKEKGKWLIKERKAETETRTPGVTRMRQGAKRA